MDADMRGHVQRHVRMWHIGLESWIRSRTRVAYVRMTREVRLAYEMGCEMFGCGQAQGHVGAWCIRSARPSIGLGAQGPQGSDCMSETLGTCRS